MKINRLHLEAEALKKELTDEQILLLRYKPSKCFPNDLNISDKLKVRRKLIQFIINKGYSIRSIALISELSPTRVYQLINK